MSIDLLKIYKERGWVIHPLTGPKDPGNSPGKKPLLTGWQNLKKTPDNIKDHINNGCNIGLVCGKASRVTVIDFDSMLFFDEIEELTDFIPLISRRTSDRCHMYFEYCEQLKSQKHPLLGIEILNDGSNAVLPSSVHASGEIYRWNDTFRFPLIMGLELIELLTTLFKTEAELKTLLSKTRPCFSSSLKNRPNVHGSDGRQFMIAICAELMAVGAKKAHLRLFSKLMYQMMFDEDRTAQELSYIDPKKTWRCATLREKLPGYVMNYCKDCINHGRPVTYTQVPDNVTEYFRTVTDKKIEAIILITDTSECR